MSRLPHNVNYVKIQNIHFIINVFTVFKGYEIEPKLKAATEGRFWLIFWQKY